MALLKQQEKEELFRAPTLALGLQPRHCIWIQSQTSAGINAKTMLTIFGNPRA